MSFLLTSSCGGQRSPQFSGSWNQWKVSASRVAFKSQFELVLSCSVCKELVVISKEPSSSTCADAFVGSWSALFLLDGNSDKRAINAIFSESELFSGPEPACVGSALVLFKNFFRLLWIPVPDDLSKRTCRKRIELRITSLRSCGSSTWATGIWKWSEEYWKGYPSANSWFGIAIVDVPESDVERSLSIQTDWMGLVLKLNVVFILCP